jgi:aspartate/tyrosine/aromatic aminotransferase
MLPIMEHPTNHEPTDEEWRTLARQASEERDPNKLLDLAEQIVEKFDEEKRRKLRLV